MPSLTMKLPKRLHAAIARAAQYEDMETADWLRTQLHCAAKAQGGIVINLELPPLTDEDRAMPLLAHAGVDVEGD